MNQKKDPQHKPWLQSCVRPSLWLCDCDSFIQCHTLWHQFIFNHGKYENAKVVLPDIITSRWKQRQECYITQCRNHFLMKCHFFEVTGTWQKHFPLKSRNALCPLLLQQVKAVPRSSTSDSRVWWFQCKVSFWIHPGQRRNCLGMDWVWVLSNFINKECLTKHLNHIADFLLLLLIFTITYLPLTLSEKQK